ALHRAEAAGDVRAILAAVRTARGNLALVARLLGQLPASEDAGLLEHPQWIAMRAALVEVLAPHPEVHAALLARMRALEADLSSNSNSNSNSNSPSPLTHDA